MSVTCLLKWTSQERTHCARQYLTHYKSVESERNEQAYALARANILNNSPNDPKPKKRRKRPVARGSRPTVTTPEGGAEKRYQEDPNA